MKRIISLLLTLIFAVGLASPSMAQEEAPSADSNLTRGEFVMKLNQLFGIYTTLGDKFTDSDEKSPYYFDLMAAKTAGYLSGFPDGTAGAEDSVNRAQAAVMFNRLLKFDEPKEEQSISDEDQIPQWAVKDVKSVSANGIIPITNNLFRPNDPFLLSDYSLAEQVIKENRWNLKRIDEIKKISSYDGYELTGRLSLPKAEDKIDKLVIFVDGTGANTYEMRRQQEDIRFIYQDFFADEFIAQGTAYFSYNTRGVSLSEEQPFYKIEEKGYHTYLPTVVAKDLRVMTDELKNDPRLKDSKIYLLGWSEGAIIAPLSVAKEGTKADGLLLAGYPNDNMRQILDWQLGGPQTFFVYQIYFNIPSESHKITREQYESDPNQLIESALGGTSFDDTDVDKDDFITENDFKLLRKPMFDGLLNAVDSGDYQWIKDNFMDLTPEWFKDHFALGSTEDIMTKVDIPIHIFHGTYDLNCPVSGVYAVENRFKELGKTNLTVNIFDEYDHDLLFSNWLLTGKIPKGIAKIFSTVAAMD